MPVSSFVLRSGVASLACLSFLATKAAAASYVLQDTYAGPTFFDDFTFFTASDPTNGFVTYVDESTALSDGLITVPSSNSEPAVFGVDHTHVYNASASGGRASVRLSSKNTYTHALIISDIGHMPGGICGTWPAHWTLGPNWPSNGEIDIIEGVNNAATNLMSLHTSAGCTIAGADELGTLQTSDCDTSVNYNSGCGVTADTTASYGTGFNGGNGGVYATEWTSSAIKIWFFPTASVPSDITAGSPDPTGWGEPQANFAGSCNIDSHFADHQIIFDTTFCGDYGNAAWNSNSQCQALAGSGATCNSYVASNPSAFTDAYWSVNSIKVYQQSGNSSFSTTSSAPLSSATPSSAVIAPGMGQSSTSGNFTRASTTSSAPYKAATPTSATDPDIVGKFRYRGCFGSTSSFATFTQALNSAVMDLETCTAACTNSRYAGVFNTQCFCADRLDTTSSIAAADGLTCKSPCPGNLRELCGGSRTTSRLAVRQASDNILLSVYENINYVSLVSVAPALQTFGYGLGGGAAVSEIVSVVLSTTFTDICDTCAGGYTTGTYTTTVVECGCVAKSSGDILGYGSMTSSAPYVPMTAYETVCGCCGENNSSATVTVTVPAGVVAIASASSIMATATNTAAAVALIEAPVASATGASNLTIYATAAVDVSGTSTASVAVFTGAATAMGASIFGLVAGGAAAMFML